ncbi:hemicentin-2-like isoform X1 [Varroa jacobsoni]|uniref:hemicentin-2-like isoform X1 n=1 Tax=Varroa jacobsoni TaxID=62625 RepID=UPI000BF53F64|nr:hemicentin-2-like isoform X1 [Varroa jacobsoni]XP_022704272.1 hemicentin-2-like isoform X1 [Varroa jacobsoni]
MKQFMSCHVAAAKVIAVSLILLPIIGAVHAFDDDELTEPTITVIGVLGERASLPCNIAPNSSDDEVSLVLWYRDDSTTPIYSADARKTSLRKAHHSPIDWLAHRAFLKVETSPSLLQLSPVQEGDDGFYRCRVDFKKERTRNYQVHLKVILPPNEPIISDQNREILPSKSVIGPYNEGDKLILVCQVEGGNPPPVVTWWRESFLLDDHYNVSNGISKNVLEIPALTRNDLMATLTCTASNNNISYPVSSSVIVDLNFRPLSVWIEGEQQPLSAGKSVTLECRASGSRPPAVIEWWKGGMRMNSTSHNSTSALTFVPTADDSGKHLSCRAENPLIANSRIEDGWKLEVHYNPILSLRLGSKLRHQHIQEGNDVFFECDIRANPWVNDIGWRFEGREVQTNTSAGVIISGQSLVLQKVDRYSRGRYTCHATNAQGPGESNAVMLKVRFAPVCKGEQKTTYGAARNELVKIFCELESDPVEIAFKWRFNNSKELISSSNVHTDGTRSCVTVVPHTEEDYGPIICWGKNSIGLQREPCVFQLIPAGPPEPVHNCTVVNQTEESLTIACQEGYDGGIEQSFHMELHDAEQRTLQGNYSLLSTGRTQIGSDDESGGSVSGPVDLQASQPAVVMSASGLAPATAYVIAVWAANARGQSPPTVIVAHTIPSPISLTRRGMWHISLSPLILVLIFVVTGIILVAFTIILIMKIRTRQVIKSSQQRAAAADEKPQIPLPEEGDVTELARFADENKGPDVIPPDAIPGSGEIRGSGVLGLGVGVGFGSSSAAVGVCRVDPRFDTGYMPRGGTLKRGTWDCTNPPANSVVQQESLIGAIISEAGNVLSGPSSSHLASFHHMTTLPRQPPQHPTQEVSQHKEPVHDIHMAALHSHASWAVSPAELALSPRGCPPEGPYHQSPHPTQTTSLSTAQYDSTLKSFRPYSDIRPERR